jgi:hypothetical protein
MHIVKTAKHSIAMLRLGVYDLKGNVVLKYTETHLTATLCLHTVSTSLCSGTRPSID